MPHSAECCLCAFEIGVSGSGGREGGREGGEGRGARGWSPPRSSFLALRGAAWALFASVASGAALFSYMLIFSCFIILSLSRYQKPRAGSGSVSFSHSWGSFGQGQLCHRCQGVAAPRGHGRVVPATTKPFPEAMGIPCDRPEASLSISW